MNNPFVFACVTPHGLPIIEELAGATPELMSKTRASMERLGKKMEEAKPETIIILTPHGLKIDGQMSVANCSFMAGTLTERTVAQMVGENRMDEGNAVHLHRPVDRDLAVAIISLAKQADIPVGSLNFATNAGVFSQLPLDWGVIVPLSFMPNVPIVVISPSRKLSDDTHLQFGQALAQAVRDSGKRVGLIASCDWSHAHDKDGPYGYHPDAEKLDYEVIEIIQSNQLERMKTFPPTFVENAKPDGIWQTLILAGAIPVQERRAEVLSYEVPTYFGLICVAYP